MRYGNTGGMVGSRSIGDWYADAEGRYSDSPGHDWENDDPQDRNRDSWLDRLQREEPRMPPPSQAAGRRSGASREAQRTAQSTGRVTRPYFQDVVNAVHTLRAERPGIGDKTLLRRLRDQGYTNVTQSDVRKALRQAPALAPSDRHRKGKQTKRVSALPVPTGRPNPSARASDFAAAARTLWTKAPDLSIDELTRLLHGRGWTMFTEADVRKVLSTLSPRPSPDRKPPRTAARKGKAIKPRQLRRANSVAASPQPRADICPSCGVAVSLLGLCRCS